MSSTIIAKNIQIGTSGTATNNFNWYQPAAPDGTVRLGVGNYGATTLDAVTVSNSGNVTVSGSVTGGAGSFTTLAASSTVSGTGFSNYLASPPAIGGTVAAAGSFTTLNASTAVRSNTYQDASGGSNAVFSGVASPPNSMGFRNRILNGGMVIDQRNAGASVTQGTSNTYCLDRWLVVGSQASKFTIQQNTADAPTANGFATCAKITSSSAYSVGASEVFFLIQKVEGFNQTDIGWGTAGAQPVTLSFLVRSSLTGTFGGCLINAAETYTFPFSYTISAANTWETKTITIPAQTAGAWNNNSNGIGIQLVFSMGCGTSLQATANTWTTGSKYAPTGATNVVGTNGATFYITGVQLEAGTVASPFERRDYGRELIMCQRYFENVLWFANGYSAQWTGAAFYGVQYPFLVQKRASPSISNFTSSGYWVAPGQNVFSANGSHSFTISGVNQNAFAAQSNRPAGGSTPSQGNMYFWEASVTIPVSAEL